jgi:alkyl hydroperoxide reductase subunit AhpC
MIVPRQKAPELIVETLDHGRFDLATEKPERFTLVCFYRGLHCPVCASYLKELARLTPAFAQRGVETLAVSSDGELRARQMVEKIAAKSLRVGYGLKLSAAREWNLYISASRGKSSIDIEEPPLFSEPGVFLIKPDRTLFYVSIQSMPFVRPKFSEMVQAVDYIILNDYPARGEYTGPA